jgi:hypothetical protein
MGGFFSNKKEATVFRVSYFCETISAGFFDTNMPFRKTLSP